MADEVLWKDKKTKSKQVEHEGTTMDEIVVQQCDMCEVSVAYPRFGSNEQFLEASKLMKVHERTHDFHNKWSVRTLG